MEPPPVGVLEVTGIDGILTWPESNVISHVQPASITLSWVGQKFTVEFDSGMDSYKFNSVNGVVNIPASTTAGAIENHATLNVYVNDDEQFGGVITFLPKSESEPFPIEAALLRSGGLRVRSGYHCTDFIDVRLAEKIIYTGFNNNTSYACVFGYDDEKNPVRVLLRTNTNTSTPVQVDFDDVSYIVACSAGATYSLNVYYKDRRRRR